MPCFVVNNLPFSAWLIIPTCPSLSCSCFALLLLLLSSLTILTGAILEGLTLQTLGSKKYSRVKYMPHLKMVWNPTMFKILGIWFTQDLKECAAIKYNRNFDEVTKLFKIWSLRTITLLGRVAILKSLILSKLIHLWILLPDPPDNFVKALQKICFQFVWNGKQDRIARKTTIKDVNSGGLNIPDIKTYILALKLT